MVHSIATNVDDPTVDPRWGPLGKQKITDEGPLPPGPKGSYGDTWTTEGRDFKYIFLDNPQGAFGSTGQLDIPRIVLCA